LERKAGGGSLTVSADAHAGRRVEEREREEGIGGNLRLPGETSNAT